MAMIRFWRWLRRRDRGPQLWVEVEGVLYWVPPALRAVLRRIGMIHQDEAGAWWMTAKGAKYPGILLPDRVIPVLKPIAGDEGEES